MKKIILTLLVLSLTTLAYGGQVNDNLKAQWAPIVASDNAGNILRSADNGATWQTYPIQATFFYILWANNQFIGVGNGGSYGDIYQSPDGINWNGAGAAGDSLAKVIFANGQYIAIGDYSSFGAFPIAISPDGKNWADHAFPISPAYNTVFLNSIAWGNGHYVLVGSFAAESQQQLRQISYPRNSQNIKNTPSNLPQQSFTATSTDGINWSITNQKNNFVDVIWDSNQFVAVSYNGVIATSQDGVTWTNQYSNSGEKIQYIVHANNTYIAVGETLNSSPPFPPFVLVSHDAIHWTYESLPISDYFNPGGVTYKNGQFVLVGTVMFTSPSGGAILTSPDGVNWSVKIAEYQYGLYAVG